MKPTPSLSRRNPPVEKNTAKKDTFKFVSVQPERPGQIPASMAKRPVGKK